MNEAIQVASKIPPAREGSIEVARRMRQPVILQVGSARLLEQLGFKALATTSSGFAWSIGRPDNHVTLDEALQHLRTVAASVHIPVNADLEGGFAVEPEGVRTNVAAAAETGVAGISIEDSSGDASNPLFDFALAVERIGAAPRPRRQRHRDSAHRSQRRIHRRTPGSG